MIICVVKEFEINMFKPREITLSAADVQNGSQLIEKEKNLVLLEQILSM